MYCKNVLENEPYSFSVNDTIVSSENSLRFRELFLEYNKNHDN